MRESAGHSLIDQDSRPRPTPFHGSSPADPENPNSVRDLQAHLNDLNLYNEQVAKLQDEYKDEIDTWQSEQEDYKNQIVTYQEDLTELEIKRAVAIGAAESTNENFKDNFGWSFVDKEDRDGYLKTVTGTWDAQLIIILILFVGTVYMQKRRDVA